MRSAAVVITLIEFGAWAKTLCAEANRKRRLAQWPVIANNHQDAQKLPMHQTIAHVSWMFEKSLGIWLAAWAVRYKAQWDYKLNATARALRWNVVLAGYWLAASALSASVRVIAGCVGLGFLCWPNFAYHLSKLVIKWPTAQGHIVSADSSSNGSYVSYIFHIGDQTFGGDARVKSSTTHFSEGQRILVAYDPLNPDESKLRFLQRRPSFSATACS